jgi:derlin-1
MCLSSGFALLMHLYFLNSWLSSLETEMFRGRKGDCFMMLMFIMISLSVIGIAAKMAVLTNSFSTAIVYIWATQNPTQIVQFMFGLRFKAVFLPWVFLIFDVIQGGSPIPGIIGIIVGHSYHFMENIYPQTHGGTKLFSTPGVIRDAFDALEPREMTGSSAGYSSQPGKTNTGGAQGSSSGSAWGRGHRLGS